MTTKTTLKNAVTFIEENFIAPELKYQREVNAGLQVNPFAEFNLAANAEAECHNASLRPVEVGKAGYTDAATGLVYSKGKEGTKDIGLYKRMMNDRGMLALCDRKVAVLLNSLKKFADGGEVTKEDCAAFYADEKNHKKIARLVNARSLAKAVVKYAGKPANAPRATTGGGSDTEAAADTAPTAPASEFLGQFAAAIAKAETGDIDAVTAKTILDALQKSMQSEFLKAAGINAAAWEAVNNSKIKKTA